MTRGGLTIVLAAAVLGASFTAAPRMANAGHAAGGGGSGTASASVPMTPAQIATGGATFQEKCSTCHGTSLEGGAGPALSGPNFKTLSTKIKATVSDVFGYMTSNMPMNAPGSLNHAQYTAIMAFVLSKNGYKPGHAPLTFEAANKSTAPVVKQ